jgi:hypothetical protein
MAMFLFVFLMATMSVSMSTAGFWIFVRPGRSRHAWSVFGKIIFFTYTGVGLLQGLFFVVIPGIWLNTIAFSIWGLVGLVVWLWLRRPPREKRKASESLGYKAKAALAKLLDRLKPSPIPQPVPIGVRP